MLESTATSDTRLKLPLTLTVRRIWSDSRAIEVDCLIREAGGQAVQSDVIAMGPKTSFAEACGILQQHVTILARSLLERGVVSAEDAATPKDVQSLVGMTFLGGAGR